MRESFRYGCSGRGRMPQELLSPLSLSLFLSFSLSLFLSFSLPLFLSFSLSLSLSFSLFLSFSLSLSLSRFRSPPKEECVVLYSGH